MKVFWTNFAKRKLKEIFSFYKKKVSKEFSIKLITGIIEKSNSLLLQPEKGAMEELLLDRKEKFRFILYNHFKIIYWINSRKKRIEIVHVFDSRQDPDKLAEV